MYSLRFSRWRQSQGPVNTEAGQWWILNWLEGTCDNTALPPWAGHEKYANPYNLRKAELADGTFIDMKVFRDRQGRVFAVDFTDRNSVTGEIGHTEMFPDKAECNTQLQWALKEGMIGTKKELQ